MHKTYSKVWELEKDTTFTFGHFTTISVHFLVNYIFIFSQKLSADGHFEGLNVSKSQLDQNLWHKSKKCLTSVFFNFGREFFENLSFKNGHFSTICVHFFGNYIDIFHKTEIQMVILRCLVCLNLNRVKSDDIKIIFFLAWKCIISLSLSLSLLALTS